MNFFNRLFKRPVKIEDFGTGWLGDLPDPEKAYKAEEIYAAFDLVVWTEKTPGNWKRYEPIRNQGSAGACVAYTVGSILGAENLLEEGKYPVLSPRMIYARGYQPGGGMFYEKALSIGKDVGSALEVLMPSEAQNEEQMRKLDDERESDRIIAKTYRGGKFVYLPLDIDAIASFIQKGKTIAFGTRFNSGGFSNAEVVLAAGGTFGHAVMGTDFTLWKGQKALVFQNSWGKDWGLGGLGVITETQLKGGGFILAAYYEELKNEAGTGEKPKLQIVAEELRIGQQNGEVMKLQIMLQYLGFFPANVKTTGYYGGITRQAVKDYQSNNNLAPVGVATGETIKSINSKFV